MSCMPEIEVQWGDGCKCLTITSSKDLSNVVLNVTGSYIKFDNLTGTTGTFCVTEEPQRLMGAWIKSGCNHNENPDYPCPEGSGCGEYFVNPKWPCSEPTPPDEENLCNTVVYTFGRS